MARVLMVAYSCEPDSSSEGAVGWRLASGLARSHSVFLLTRPKARDQIERELAADRSLDIEVEYHEMDGLRRLKYMGLPVSNLRYLAWNHRVGKRVAQLTTEGRFDLVHHTTWVRYWMPSAAGRSTVPFVWGPVGGAERTPPRLLSTLGPRALMGELAKSIGPVVLELDPLMRATRQKATISFPSSRETAEVMSRWGIPTRLVPSVAHAPADLPAQDRRTIESDYISVGRLIGWKGFHLGIQAFARSAPADATYTVVGDGPEMARLRRLAEKLGVAGRVRFLGQLSRSETLQKIAASGMLVHPSFHDSGGFVVVEALALGVPVVCLDIGGPALLVGTAGRTIPAGSPRQVIGELGAAMADPGNRGPQVSAAARARAAESLTWDRIVNEYDAAYRTVLGG